MNKLLADWIAPINIKAFMTLRSDSQNHITKNDLALPINRSNLKTLFNKNQKILWLNQIHSNRCIIAGTTDDFNADAIITRSSEDILAVMTADCLPILLCNIDGTEIAAIHAGWRGLATNIIQSTIAKMTSNPNSLTAWIGPSICKDCYEIGIELKNHFLNTLPFSLDFMSFDHGKCLFDLIGFAKQILRLAKVEKIYSANLCTFEDDDKFFSYRRDGQTGRMATLIWIDNKSS